MLRTASIQARTAPRPTSASQLWSAPGVLTVSAGSTTVLWLTRLNDVSPFQVLLAFLLLLAPLASFAVWKRDERLKVPLFALVSSVYWLYYAVPLFWGDRRRPSAFVYTLLPDSSITMAMVLAVLAVASLALGMYASRSRLRAAPFVFLRESPGSLNYLRVALLVTMLLSIVPVGDLVGAQLRQIVVILQTTVPLTLFVLLFRRVLEGRGSAVDTLLLVSYAAVTFVAGLSSGWLGFWLEVALASLILYVSERRKLPRLPLLLVVAYVLFFQPGKQAFRSQYWGNAGGTNTTVELGRLSAWVNYSLQAWTDALTHRGGTSVLDVVRPTVMRTSLLTQSANVVMLTPTVVPYQNGSLYTGLVSGLVPRFLWPDKPSVNEANQFYQVTYGVTELQRVDAVSIAVGVPTEAYINFGWPGVVFVMLLLGLLFAFVQQTFLLRDSGPLLNAFGIILVLQFMTIESQMSQYLGGVLQHLILLVVVLWPVLHLRRSELRHPVAEG